MVRSHFMSVGESKYGVGNDEVMLSIKTQEKPTIGIVP